MPLLLGVDTGGTYTDAVLLSEQEEVLSIAKALTTRDDLSIGIRKAISGVLEKSAGSPGEIGLVSLSTTLATNALVEGNGGRICLVLIGFDNSHLARSGLGDALRGDPVISVNGGHNAHGDPVTELDITTFKSKLSSVPAVTGFAVAGLFAVRNADHEVAVRDCIRAKTGLPVTCSHELTSDLDGPRRALTCVLNARLISLLHNLITSTQRHMSTIGIDAPVMVVRGDGALISADFAKNRPIETILSGPAASLIGAAHLTGHRDAIISDIGGTTTDIAILKDGQPRLDKHGATVGGWRTMVEAVAMRTVGLGGDSEVRLATDGLDAKLILGPRRVIPLSLMAIQNPELVHDSLERQLRRRFPSEYDGYFLIPIQRVDVSKLQLTNSEQVLYKKVLKGPTAADRVSRSPLHSATLNRLITRGLVMVSGFTPSDAAHVLGRQHNWDIEAARKGAKIFARRRDGRGQEISDDHEALCQWIIHTLILRSAEVILDTALAEDGYEQSNLSEHVLITSALLRQSGVTKVDVSLKSPLIGLGAPAETYYPDVSTMLRTKSVIPKYFSVANAIGAVVGRVTMSSTVVISTPHEKLYRVHLNNTPSDFESLSKAVDFAEAAIRKEALERAMAAGAIEVEIKLTRADRQATIGGSDLFIESRLTATASGRARIAI